MKLELHCGGAGDIFLKFEPENTTEENLLSFVCSRKIEPTFTGQCLLLKTGLKEKQ